MSSSLAHASPPTHCHAPVLHCPVLSLSDSGSQAFHECRSTSSSVSWWKTRFPATGFKAESEQNVIFGGRHSDDAPPPHASNSRGSESRSEVSAGQETLLGALDSEDVEPKPSARLPKSFSSPLDRRPQAHDKAPSGAPIYYIYPRYSI